MCLLRWNPSTRTRIKGKYICPGNSNDMSSLCAELFGALGIVLGLRNMVWCQNIVIHPNAKMWIYIDNREVIERMMKWESYNQYNVLRPEYEIEEMIIQLGMAVLPYCRWTWIKGHNAADTSAAGVLNKVMDHEVNTIRDSNHVMIKICLIQRKQGNHLASW